ncbi:MAG: hypothetical protein NC039_03110 [Muribaculaceae bacterium]|nr:hypothetical protein [Muribaculaceae bacterium]
MKNLILSLAALVALLIASSCNRYRIDSRLIDVEAGMDVDPDSVRSLLLAINPSELIDDHSRALYGMLLARAGHKMHIVDVDDSLINVSVEFFKKNGPRDLLMKSLFYQGVIRWNRGDYREAMFSAERSKEISEEMQDFYWMAKNYELIADIFHSTYNNPDQLEAREKAAIYYGLAGKELNHLFAMLDYASILGDAGKVPEQLDILDSLLSLPQTRKYDGFLGCLFCDYFDRLVDLKEFDYASQIADSVRSHYPFPQARAADLVAMATLEFHKGNTAEMLDLIEKASQSTRFATDSLRIYWLLLHHYEREGDLKKAMAMEDSVLAVNNRQIDSAISQSGITAQRDMARIDLLEEELRSQRARYGMVIIGLLALAVIIGGIAAHRFKMARKQLELSDSINAFEVLSIKYKAATEENASLSAKMDILAEHQRTHDSTMAMMGGMFSSQWQALNNLCAVYNRKKGSGVEKTLVKDIHDIVQELLNRPNILKIKECVNATKDGLMDRLERESAGRIPHDGLRLALLLFAGFQPAAIALMTDTPQPTIYSRRNLLIKTIQSLHLPSESQILANI